MDIVEYYDRYFAEGVIDLSSSSADGDWLPPGPKGAAEAPFMPPSGGADLREQVAHQFTTVTANDVVLSAGASEALVAIANAVIKPGAGIAVDRGTYPSFTHAAELRGGVVRRAAHPHLAHDAAIASICNPTVPGGRLRRLREPSVITVVDESHIDLVHDDHTPVRAADVSARYISVGGLSKGFGLGGLRVGWAVCRDASLLAAIDHELQLLSGGPAALSVQAAARVLDTGRERLDDTMRAVKMNLPAICRALEAAGWRYTLPEAGLTMDVRPPRRVRSAAEQAARDAGYFIVPGRVYGTYGSYRLGLLAPVQHVRKALTILGGD